MAHASSNGSEHSDETSQRDIDVIIVGAGLAGIYGAYKFRQQGLSVIGIEAASGFGGLWYHHRYPGARLDLDSVDYTYYFSREIWEKCQWRERYAAQPDLLAYLNFVADEFDLRRHFRFDTRVIEAQWRDVDSRYHIATSTGERFSCRFLVMATGQLSAARRPAFVGLERFRGQWVQTSHWPSEDVPLEGKRIGIIGTGSSGVQAIPILAEHASHLYVFQRTPHYTVPARNAPISAAMQAEIGDRLEEERERLLGGSGVHRPRAEHPLSHYTAEEQRARLESQWELGGQGMNALFSDQGIDKAVNDVVAEFVRDKIRSIVRDRDVAETLCPAYPIGTHRLALDTGFYETFNRENVTLVDVKRDPIVEITESGIRTEAAHYELDLIIFALGFQAFTGSLDAANIRNGAGKTPSDGWRRGPRTLLGLMTAGFPNLFMPTAPGSPSVLANMFLQNEFHLDWIAECIAYLDARGLASIEPSEAAQDAWTEHVAAAADRLLRRQEDNYMVHVNEDDGSRVFIPYVGGLSSYVESARRMASAGYEGFILRDGEGRTYTDTEAVASVPE